MSDALWWLPSVIVLAVVAGVIALLVTASRRKSRGIRAAQNAEVAERARSAAISLVRADDLIEAASDELGFAIAQFGERATADFAEALTVSKRQLREAFALKQKLDDGVPDTDAQIRQWTEQITRLADEATARLDAQTRDFDTKRVVEQNAPIQLEQLRRRLDRATDRLSGGAATLNRLTTSYSASALAAISGNVERARTAIDAGRRAADAADARLAAGATEPVGEQVSAAEHALFTATALLDAIETGEDQLHVGFASLGAALAAAETELAEARALRDRHEESDASADLNRVIAAADTVLAELRRPDRVSDPSADLARLREAPTVSTSPAPRPATASCDGTTPARPTWAPGWPRAARSASPASSSPPTAAGWAPTPAPVWPRPNVNWPSPRPRPTRSPRSTRPGGR